MVQHVVPAEGTGKDISHVPLPSWNPQRQPQKSTKENNSEEKDHVRSYLDRLFGIPAVTSKWKYYFGPLGDSYQHAFYESKICVSPYESISICLETHDQSNPVWRRERRMRITASECYDLFTYYNNDDGSRDWIKKLSPILHPMEMRLPQLVYGKETESKALHSYRRRNIGKTVIRMGLVIPPQVPYLGCSPDAVALEERTLIEIKCPVVGKYKPATEIAAELKWLENKNGEFYLRKKHSYYGQIQLGMCLLKLEKAELVIYCEFNDDYLSICVPYDKDFIARLIPVLRDIFLNIFLPILCSE